MTSADTFEADVLELLVQYDFEQIIRSIDSGHSVSVFFTDNPQAILKVVEHKSLHKAYRILGKACSNHKQYLIQLSNGLPVNKRELTKSYSVARVDGDEATK